jgi:hypothetical protein
MFGACIGQGLLETLPRELARYKLNLVGAQEVRWNTGGTVITGKLYSFPMGKKRKSSTGNRSFCS